MRLTPLTAVGTVAWRSPRNITRKEEPMLRRLAALTLALGLLPAALPARDWYVSIARGKGKKGTIEKPAKEIGNINEKLEPGDRIFVAEGTYLGRGDSGATKIEVPVELYGGFSDDFTKRDPWGAHKTIITGLNKTDNYEHGYLISVDLSKWRDAKSFPGPNRYAEPKHVIVVDGFIFDNGPRNRYKTDEKLAIVRMANPKTGENPTPSYGGVSVVPWWGGSAIVRNNVVINTAPSEAVIALWGNKGSLMLAENNLVVNNTGNGIQALTSWHGEDKPPRFVIRNNTSLFNQKFGAFETYGGSGFKAESDCFVKAVANVFGFNDNFGFDNMKRSKKVFFNNNNVFANLQADYIEFDTKMSIADLEDEADNLEEAEDNVSTAVNPPVSDEWKKKYQARTIIDRNAAEVDVKVGATGANALRSMLGLNLQGSDLKIDSEVWLPLITPDDALKAGMAQYEGRGCQKPAAGGGDVPAPSFPEDEYSAWDE